MNFYVVTAKCGHVGRGNYYKGEFFISAGSRAQAAQIVRGLPRVKHHHKDAIMAVAQITYEQYREGRQQAASNPYFSCKSRREQDAIYESLVDNIYPERDKKVEAADRFARQRRLAALRRAQRRSAKYSALAFEA